MDIRFVCDGPILYTADIDGGNHVPATAFAVAQDVIKQRQRYCGPDTTHDALDADIIHGNVCMDAGGFGSVLDSIKRIRYYSDADYKKAIQLIYFLVGQDSAGF